MKKIIGTMVLIAFASSASASINLSWVGSNGFLLNDDATGLLENGGYSYAQLVFTTSASPNFVLPGATLTGETLITSRWLSQTNGGGVLQTDEFGSLEAVNVTTANSGFEFQAGNIFARIYAPVASADTSLIVEGSFYYWGPVIALVPGDAPPALPSLIYDMHRNQSSFGIGDPIGPGYTEDGWQNTVVPEPSVMALLGLGGLMLAIRRQRMAA